MPAQFHHDERETSRYGWLPAWIVACLFGACAAIIPLVSGSFWPVLAGRLVVRHHAGTFTHDPFSVLALRGDTWVVQPWLSAVIMHATWRVGHAAAGVTGALDALGVLSVVLAITTGLCIHSAVRAVTWWLPALLATIVSLVLLLPLPLHTESFALACGAALLLVLMRAHSMWWAVPLVVVWTNVHGSFPMAVVLCACAALGTFGNTPVVARAAIGRRIGWLCVVAAATLVSPLGIHAISYVRSVTSVSGLTALTPAWGPLSLLTVDGLIVIAVTVGAAVVLLRSSSDDRPGVIGRIVRTVPVIALAGATFHAQRYLPWFTLASLPALTMVIGAALRRPRPIASPLIAWTCAIAAGVLLVIAAPGTPLHHAYARLGLPSDKMLSRVRARDTVFASAEWADYVALRTGARVFVDARLERFRAADLDRYRAATAGQINDVWERRSDIIIVRTHTAGPLERALPGIEPGSTGTPARGREQWCRVARNRWGSTWVRSARCPNG